MFELHLKHYGFILLIVVTLNYALFSIIGQVFSLICQCIVLFPLSWKLATIINRYYNKKYRITSINKSVLITGCDTGFGNLLAHTLNSEGFVIYATVLDTESHGAKCLKENAKFPDNLKVLKMDVTCDSDVANALSLVEKDLTEHRSELWGLVNNAGILTLGHIDWGTIESYRKLFEVNTFGLVRVTRSFLPLIRQSKGRIVNVSSINGELTWPCGGIYCMTKHAVVSFSDALRRELRSCGVSVCTILPGAFRTAIISEQNTSRVLEYEWNNASESVRQVYGKECLESTKRHFKEIYGENSSANKELVVNAMIDALTSECPQISYTVYGTFATFLLMIFNNYLPVEWTDKLLYYNKF